MFHSRAIKHRTNRIIERALTFVHPDQNCTNIDICKAKNKISPGITGSLFEFPNISYYHSVMSIIKTKGSFTVHILSESHSSVAPEI